MDWLNHVIDLIFKDPVLLLVFAVGAVLGWFVAFRQSETYRRLARDIQDAYKIKIEFLQSEVREREILTTRLENKIKELELIINSLRGPTPPEGNPPVFERETKSTWEQVSKSLMDSGIPTGSIEGLKAALLNREMGLHDSDGRLRVRVLNRGADKTPVAILWRGRQNYRVLFPDGTDDLVKVVGLSEVAPPTNTA